MMNRMENESGGRNFNQEEIDFEAINLENPFDDLLEAETVPAEADEGETAQQRLLHWHDTHNCTFAVKSGKTLLYDEDEEKFISLPFADKTGELREMAEAVELGCGGWKYRTEPDGRWGFISRDFSQVISPRFEGIAETGEEQDMGSWTRRAALIAWGRDVDAEPIMLELDLWFSEMLPAGPFLCRLGELIKAAPKAENYAWDKTLPLSFERCMTAEKPEAALTMRGDFSVGGGFSCVFTAGQSFVLFICEEEDGTVYCDVGEFGCGPMGDPWNCGVLHFPRKGALPVLRGEAALEDCLRLHASEVRYDSLSCRCADGSVYLDKKDGMWGFFLVTDDDEPWRVHPAPLTPYAFTHVQPPVGFSPELMLVERFGLWGLYDAKEDRYVIPCAYDEVRPDYPTFIVRRAGTWGRIDLQGTWLGDPDGER